MRKISSFIILCCLFTACEVAYEFGSITNRDLTDLVPVPAWGATRVRIFTQEEYTGSVIWLTSNGEPLSGVRFEAGTEYTAVITLTARPGYSFGSVTENSFTHQSAIWMSNPAGSAASLDMRILASFRKTRLPVWLASNTRPANTRPPTGYSVRACCYRSGFLPTHLNDHAGGTGWIYTLTGIPNSHFQEELEELQGYQMNFQSSLNAHTDAMNALELESAHFFSFDLGSVYDVIAISYHPLEANFISSEHIGSFEIWISDDPIGVNPRVNAVKAVEGEFMNTTYEYHDLNLLPLRVDGQSGPIRSRYLQLRVTSSFDGSTNDGIYSKVRFSMSEFHFGIVEDDV